MDDTVISADTMNTTIADLASMIEDSLSRSGFGGMNVPLAFQSGTVSAPGIAFDSDPNTGLYDEAADNPAIAAGGVKAQEWTPTGTTVPGTLAVTGAATVGGSLSVVGAIAASGGITSLTRTSLPAVGQQVSGSSGAFATSSLTLVDVTNLSVSLTTSGRPVIVGLMAAGTGFGGYLGAVDPTVTAQYGSFALLRDGVELIRYSVGDTAVVNITVRIPASSVSYLDIPVAGTYTYKIQALASSATTTCVANSCKLFAFEL